MNPLVVIKVNIIFSEFPKVHLKQEQPKDNWTRKTEDFYNTNGTLKSASTIKALQITLKSCKS
jgi:hypothetical protein